MGVPHEISRLPTRGKSDGAAIGYMLWEGRWGNG
jgi:hypothetical protein